MLGLVKIDEDLKVNTDEDFLLVNKGEESRMVSSRGSWGSLYR